MSVSAVLSAQFGGIDIYLFDQLLQGRFDDRRRVLDAGSGGGRNLPFFVAQGFEISAIDRDPAAVALVQRLAPQADVRCGELDALPWDTGTFDAVICSAVLHFARDDAHFVAMVREMWRVVGPGGLFFARLATSIGMERLLPATCGRMRLPDGSDRFVVDEQKVMEVTRALGGRLLDPLKSTIVQGQRVMSTWVMEKESPVQR
jgi:SAM-dependent methyltransferase